MDWFSSLAEVSVVIIKEFLGCSLILVIVCIVIRPLLERNRSKSSKVETSSEILNQEQKEVSGSSSMASSVFNLVNNIAGAGILTLSSGMSKGSSTGFFPAMMICIIFGSISAHTFIMIGRACEITDQKTFKVIRLT